MDISFIKIFTQYFQVADELAENQGLMATAKEFFDNRTKDLEFCTFNVGVRCNESGIATGLAQFHDFS